MEKTILALDTATHTGYAIYKNGRITKHGTWKFKSESREWELLVKLEKTIEQEKITHIVAEDVYVDPRKPGAWQALTMLRGIIKAVQCEYECELSFIEYKAAKKCVCNLVHGSYLKGKEEMIWAVTRLGYELKTSTAHDEADAIAILITYLCGRRLPITHPMTEN
jgi:Holliday junction resolvasome RuvABC endonuclease subunit